ncbi:glycosyltransferase family 2 protein [methanotrophic endosymbiont of Bathymodiolus puteoserpentis (Logatchev)]|jgi:glycosyltransferase involved in cell wall biosynthesis|uniref:glycosyltransferase family 2 protein n=1 Tax=methanotrophic endosymbiont of Bathymodiolus puteoserpentis (Logatchev) TaxID=343235 RepID=UPI0013C8C4A1|nr:glycosyltransferase family 2 protein [methanotrophic endosymbiont of Bathymodiolus puteoserpentis (Logatchev)]SHE23143.1 Polymyxin resistance protein ArnC, glycosyl transferase [methanotrophic endosymbiont of Bathymodiolus puteoserpentis (Logatchev)]
MSTISIVIPAKDERENIQPLVDEIYSALAEQQDFEIIYIDDGSSDGTFDEIVRLKNAGRSKLRVLQHAQSVGQSTAVYSGIKAAKGELIVTLDADGQNDPADIPAMLLKAQQFNSGEHFCIAGYRKNRKDTAWYRFQSRLANKVRSSLLGDGTPDTGCGLKVFPKATFLQLPYFDHMHRFLPALIGRLQGEIVVAEVKHRNRLAGVSKYNMWNRLWVGIVDMLGVMWLQRRTKHAKIIKQA